MKKVRPVIFILACSIQGLIAQGTNNCLHFESNSYVQLNPIAQDVSNLNEFTVEFWVKFDRQQNTDYNVFYAVNSSSYGNRFLIRFTGPTDGVSDVAIVLVYDGTNQYIVGATPIGDDKCHHIAFTYNNSVCKLYVDGQLDGSGNYTTVFQPTDVHSLGQEYDPASNPTSQYYNGELDDFRIWNIAKSQSEIDTNKDLELVGNEFNLVAYYNFNQGVASGNNTSMSSLNNITQPSQNGMLVNFNLNGSTSNFIMGSCSNSAVGIDKTESSHRVEVNPNPTSGLINISNHENISSIIVKNTIGQILFNLEPNSTIDISTLPNANYVIEFVTNDNRKYVHKVFKL